ncbi:MAG: hypothetical protein ACJ77K_12300 [Bacteroidia bacterium]|jgi:hypothetical protein
MRGSNSYSLFPLKIRLLSGFCLLFLLISSSSFAQAPGLLELDGRTTKDGKALSGATITVYRGGTTEMVKIKTGKNGKFELSLPFGTDYKVSFSYPGCVDMYMMVYTGKLPKEKNNIFPLYETEVPFFDLTSTTVRISKYKNPFTKVIYDGKKAFMDDEAYLAQFTKDLLIDPEEAAKALADKEAKEKAERDKIAAAEKAKADAEEKARLDAEAKAAAEARLAAEAREKEAELARMKAEASKEKEPDHTEETMETEAIRLQRDKEAKDQIAKKNKEIKTNYENDLLKMVAENERIAKQKAYSKQKAEARSNTVITQMRKEADVKAKSNDLREQEKLKKQMLLENKQVKNSEMRKLVEAAAFAERSVKISNQKELPDVNGYVRKETPNFAVTVDDGILKTTRTTVISFGKHMDTYRKEIYFWGSVYCYKNNIEITEAQYDREIAFYSGYQNK